MEVLLQKSSLTLTAIALVPVLAMAFSLTVPGIVSDVATVTKGAGPWRSVNLQVGVGSVVSLADIYIVLRMVEVKVGCFFGGRAVGFSGR